MKRIYMVCKYCGARLEKVGIDGYICPNSDGFSSESEVLKYMGVTKEKLKETLEDYNLSKWEDVTCQSDLNNVYAGYLIAESEQVYE